ncbi:MAG: pyrimidine/purine nucleoside phosphorylase [Steroidobacteraceae bacterium]
MLQHNSYFDGGVQSLAFERNGLRASIGVITPGEYHFGTGSAERMTVTSGLLRVKLAGAEWQNYSAGTVFEIAANSGFEVQAVGGPAAYLCEYLGG